MARMRQLLGYNMADEGAARQGCPTPKIHLFDAVQPYSNRGNRDSTSATYCCVSGMTPFTCRLSGPS